MRVLHVISECPYPPNNGGRADVWARIEAMAELGYAIDLVIMTPDGSVSEEAATHILRYVKSLRIVRQYSTRSRVATMAPTRVSRNARLKRLPLDQTYDLTLMEAEDSVPILDNPTLRSALCVLRVHNNERRYMADLSKAEEKFLRRQFFRMESWRFEAYSRAAFRRVNALWFISAKERDEVIEDHPNYRQKAEWLPPGVVRTVPAERVPGVRKAVLFVGSLDIPLNREALEWYVHNVHPQLSRDSMYHLVVAGNTNGRAAAMAFASALRAVTRCTVHLDRPDLSALYGECAVFINPMLRGGGVKLKTIHAVANGIPVVSTTVGIEGSGLRDDLHVKVADTADEFAAQVEQLLSNPVIAANLARAATQVLLRLYDTRMNLQRLVASIRDHTPVEQQLAHPPVQ